LGKGPSRQAAFQPVRDAVPGCFSDLGPPLWIFDPRSNHGINDAQLTFTSVFTTLTLDGVLIIPTVTPVFLAFDSDVAPSFRSIKPPLKFLEVAFGCAIALDLDAPRPSPLIPNTTCAGGSVSNLARMAIMPTAVKIHRHFREQSCCDSSRRRKRYDTGKF
jgi:hypothetical protein